MTENEKNLQKSYDNVMKYAIGEQKNMKVFGKLANEYFEELSTVICERLLANTSVRNKFADFYVSEEMIRGEGFEALAWADKEPETVNKDNCCTSSCPKCKRTLYSRMLKNEDWKRICDQFSTEQLFDSFCKGSPYLARLSLTMLEAQNNDRIRYINNRAIEEISNIQNYWIDGVKGQIIETSNIEETLYKLILEFNQGSKRYNEIQKYYETIQEQIYIFGNFDSMATLADALSKRFSSLFTQCGIGIDCTKLHWITVPITNIDFAVLTLDSLVLWDVFNTLLSELIARCMEYAYYLHFKIGARRNPLHNAVGIKIVSAEDPDMKNAKQLKSDIEAITGADLILSPTDNLEASAKTAVQAKIDEKITDKKGLTFEYVYSNFKAATSTENKGAISVVVNIKKDNKLLQSTNLKTFELNFKEASPPKTTSKK